MSSEAKRMHARLSQQAHQHEAYFTEQLAEVQEHHKATLSQVISDLRASLDEQFQAREAELRQEKQLEIQQHLKVQANKHDHELAERLNAQAAEIWEIRYRWMFACCLMVVTPGWMDAAKTAFV